VLDVAPDAVPAACHFALARLARPRSTQMWRTRPASCDALLARLLPAAADDDVALVAVRLREG